MVSLGKALLRTLLVLCVLPVPGLAQEPAAGVVLQASHGQVGATKVSSGTSLFSGDLVSTDDQGQVQIQAGGTKLVLQASSSIRLFRSAGQIVAELERGTVDYATSGRNEELVIYALDSRLVPNPGAPAAGQITVVSRCELRATSRTSTLEVRSGKETKTIEESKSYSVRADFGVEYHDSWKPVPADYPEFDANSAYHRSHSHGPCGLAKASKGQPRTAGSHFDAAVPVVAGVVLCVVLCREFESPDKPKN